MDELIPVTKPFLPPREDLNKLIDGIYSRNWLTNNGPLVNQLEKELPAFLNYSGHFSYLNNGTIALQIAIKALELTGEIITTPFSYVATTSSIVWEGCTPVFVDIHPSNCNIDASKIEASITSRTSAILATHVYGNPCDIDAIAAIAKKYRLKVIYDAAHCFGTRHRGKSVFEYGDISTTSFHATKLFHTIEGGGIFTQDKALAHKISYMRNFGHNGQEEFWGVGINGKNSEFHAAMGLVNLNYAESILLKRKQQWLRYKVSLAAEFQTLEIQEQAGFNYAYFPLFFKDEEALLQAKQTLEAHQIYPRRYFYPSLNTIEYCLSAGLPVSEQLSSRVLTLPLYDDLNIKQQEQIIELLKIGKQ
jgi:dTDP-4-amino-4,6-dideoxygalactose transaminase